MRIDTKLAITLLALAALSACGGGGGGGGGGGTTPTPPTPPTPPAPVVNTAPVANAGAAQTVVAGAAVTLDGTASSDANGDALTYSWAITSRPAGSTAALAPATSSKPVFTADVAGNYVATLLVSDGKAMSTAATVSVTATVPNGIPVANPGTPQRVMVGTAIKLDGSASSDSNGDALTYKWTLTTRPAGSAAVLSSATDVKPSFIPDVGGNYVATLVVNDGKTDSAAASVTAKADASGHLGVPYLSARNGLIVTLNSFVAVEKADGNIHYTADYTQMNPTAAPITEGDMTMFFVNGPPLPPQGFFIPVQPGQSLNRVYTFVRVKTDIPSILEYDLEDFIYPTAPMPGSMRWAIPVPPK